MYNNQAQNQCELNAIIPNNDAKNLLNIEFAGCCPQGCWWINSSFDLIARKVFSLINYSKITVTCDPKSIAQLIKTQVQFKSMNLK